MSLGSSVMTIVTSKPAALSLAAAKHSLHLLPFAANEDGAEKGVSPGPVLLDRMKRVFAQKSEGPLGSGEKNAASTGISRHASHGEIFGGREILSDGFPSGESITGTVITGESTLPTTSLGKDNGTNSELKDDENPLPLGDGYERLVDRCYDSYPHGTPQLAALQSSSGSLAIWRRFSRSHCRLLQRMQNQISALEQKLDELDKQDAETDMEYRLRRNDWNEDMDTAQEELLEDLKSKMLEYDDLLLKDSQLRRLAPAPVRDHHHLFNWIWGTKPLDAGHYDFILHYNDFVSSSERKASGFDDLIEFCLSRWPASPFNYFMRVDDDLQDSNVRFFSRDRITLIARIMTLCLAVSILLIPIFLFLLADPTKDIASIIVLIFVLVFAIVISLFTRASTESIFFGSCAYAAVLVTFLGNVSPALKQ